MLSGAFRGNRHAVQGVAIRPSVLVVPMPRPFIAQCLTLEELLGGRLRLSVPGYQRAYSWTTDQAGQLLDDILVALDEDDLGQGEDAEADYFLGAVILMEVPASGSPTSPTASPMACEIVDGLQRLVTLSVLFAVLRDITEDDDPQTAALAAACIAEATQTDHPDPEGLHLELAGPAQAFFRSFVQQPRATSAMPHTDDLPPAEARLLAVREHLMASLIGEPPERLARLVAYLRSHCHCAVITARTLDRAHHIFAVLNDRGLPLARGDILKAQILGSVSGERRSDIHARWLDIEQRLGGTLDGLFSHLRTIEGRSRARILDEIKSLVERSGNAEAFVETTLFPYAEILHAIESCGRETSLPEQIRSRLTYLGWLGSRDWIPPLMSFWRRVDGEVGALTDFLARLDRLAYGMRLLGIGSDKRLVRYRAVLEAIRTNRLLEPSSPLELSRDEQRLIAFNMRSLHTRSQLACKLVLLRLNDLVAGMPQGLDPAELTVEHVLPQKPGRSSLWRDWFPKSDERERCTQSLGNLILVSRHENEQARNSDLARKQEIYFGQGAIQPALTREIEGLDEWRPEDVRRREERFVALLSEQWRLGAGRTGTAGTAGDDAASAKNNVRARPQPSVQPTSS